MNSWTGTAACAANSNLSTNLNLAAASIQRLTHENDQLRRALEQATNVARLATNPRR